jgi:hypothetical protein
MRLGLRATGVLLFILDNLYINTNPFSFINFL